MDSLSLDASRVNLRSARLLRTLVVVLVSVVFLLAPFCAFASFQRFKRYMVPGIPKEQKQLTAAFGYFDDMVLRSKRTSDGRRHDGDEIAFLIAVLDQAEGDGFDDLEVVIHYRKLNIEITYATTITYLRQHGRRVLGVSGWELSMPRCLWSVDGNPPTGAQTRPEPVAQQAPLFDMPVERKLVY